MAWALGERNGVYGGGRQRQAGVNTANTEETKVPLWDFDVVVATGKTSPQTRPQLLWFLLSCGSLLLVLSFSLVQILPLQEASLTPQQNPQLHVAVLTCRGR